MAKSKSKVGKTAKPIHKKPLQTKPEPSKGSYYYGNGMENQDEDEEDVLPKWYEEFPPDTAEFAELPIEKINALKSEAKAMMDGIIAKHELENSRSSKQSDVTWMKTIMANGTTSDKIAAYTLSIQDSPLHSLSTIQSFINMVKLGKKECLMVIQTLSELFLSYLLPPERKLRVFAACPLSLIDQLCSGNQVTRTKHLTRWYFEDQLKELYHEFLTHLNAVSRDSLEAHKEKAVITMFKLLSGHPEKESAVDIKDLYLLPSMPECVFQFLLTLLVNKLGDPNQKVGSKTIYCLTQLLQNHPAMKGVVMEEIEKLIFRPNISPKAQYYGVCFLSQFYFSTCDGEVAKNMIKIYFSFFKSCVKKGDVDTRMMHILLSGVNRAFPFVSKDNADDVNEHLDMLYKIVHIANYNVSLQALCLVFQVAEYSDSVSDRFYVALYKKLDDPLLATSSHHAMFLSLLFKALRKNQNLARGRVFVKRMLQACEYLPSAVACGVLFLASKLLQENKEMLTLQFTESKFSGNGDSEDECYDDADEEAASTVKKSKKEVDFQPSTWFHVHNNNDSDKKSHPTVIKYDANQRNPLYAGGEHCAYAELTTLTRHYHPSVALFAGKILAGQSIQYPGDPLQDFTLIRFLDRFVFKNPKQIVTAKDLNPSPFARKKNYSAKGLRSLAVNSNSYLNEVQEKIPVEEMYMYSYLQKKREQGVRVNSEDKDDDDDNDSVGSDDFNEMMDGLMGGKRDEELDFADDIGDKLTASEAEKKKGSKSAGNSDQDEDDDDDDDSDDGEDSDEEMEDDMSDFDDDDDDEEIEFGGDEEDDLEDNDELELSEEEEAPKKNKEISKKKKILAKYSGSGNSIFASADEFAALLEDEGSSSLQTSGSNALSNKDNSGEKQLKWEMKRNEQMSNDKWKGGKKRKRDGANHQGKKFNKVSKKIKKH